MTYTKKHDSETAVYCRPHWFMCECVFVKEAPSHGDILQLNKWGGTPSGWKMARNWIPAGCQPESFRLAGTILSGWHCSEGSSTVQKELLGQPGEHDPSLASQLLTWPRSWIPVWAVCVLRQPMEQLSNCLCLFVSYNLCISLCLYGHSCVCVCVCVCVCLLQVTDDAPLLCLSLPALHSLRAGHCVAMATLSQDNILIATQKWATAERWWERG